MPLIAKDNALLIPDTSDGVGPHNVVDGKRTIRFRVPTTDLFIAVSSSQDGQQMLVLTDQGDVFTRSADAKEFKLLGNYPKALNAELTPDGKQFLVAYDLSPIVYDTASGKEVVTFEGKWGFVRYASFVNGGRHAVSVHGNNFVRLWDAQTGKQVQQINLPGAGFHLAVSGDGRSVAAAVANPDVIQVWRLESSGAPATDPKPVKNDDPKTVPDGPIATSLELSDRIVDCFYSSDGKKIYAAASGGALHVLDPLTLKEIAKYNAIDGQILHAAAAPKSVLAKADRSKEWLYILDDQKHVFVFDSEKSKVTKTLSFETQLNDTNRPYLYTLLVTPDAQSLLLLNPRGFRWVSWNLKSEAEIRLNPLQRSPFMSSTYTAAFSADKAFGVASSNGKLLVWSGKTGLDVATLNCQQIEHLAIVPEANAVIGTGHPQYFAAWNYVTGKVIWDEKLPFMFGGLTAIPKSKRVAFTTPNDIVIRDCVTGEDVQRWKRDRVGINLTASADGRFLVSFGGPTEKKLRLWAVPAAIAKKP
jgi:WD40 repeat protein